MEISTAIALYLKDTPYMKWDLAQCLRYLANKCQNLTSGRKQEIIAEIKTQLDSLSTHQSICQRGRMKASNLCKSVDMFFESKETTSFFEEMDVRVSNVNCMPCQSVCK